MYPGSPDIRTLPVDAAHITALLLDDGWHINWDGRYNANLIAAHLQRPAGS